jgi:hypothetical protein
VGISGLHAHLIRHTAAREWLAAHGSESDLMRPHRCHGEGDDQGPRSLRTLAGGCPLQPVGPRCAAKLTTPTTGHRPRSTGATLTHAGFLVFLDRPKASAAGSLGRLGDLGIAVKVRTHPAQTVRNEPDRGSVSGLARHRNRSPLTIRSVPGPWWDGRGSPRLRRARSVPRPDEGLGRRLLPDLVPARRPSAQGDDHGDLRDQPESDDSHPRHQLPPGSGYWFQAAHGRSIGPHSLRMSRRFA